MWVAGRGEIALPDMHIYITSTKHGLIINIMLLISICSFCDKVHICFVKTKVSEV